MNSEVTNDNSVWDVVVVGGGASGMMAASTASQSGARVLLLEKNPVLGKKLSITGGGRCNVTNNKTDVRTMLAQYKDDGKFLFSTFTQHGVAESVDWFLARGVFFKEENEGRFFPQTESALTIVETLKAELVKFGVEVKTKQSVERIIFDDKQKLFRVTVNGVEIQAKACVVATGGFARPETGSTGEGFTWLESLGHKISANNSALVPLVLGTSWTKKLSGLALTDAKIGVYAYDKKQSSHRGRMLFTHVGVTGPLILNMSKEVGDFLDHTKVTLQLDVYPNHDAGALKEHLKKLLSSNKKLHNALAEELPLQLVKGVLGQLDIDSETPCHSVSSADRKKLLTYLKHIPLLVKSLLGSDKAVISSGGVALEEIDFKTMESKLVPGLYIVGDLLNINRPSGGYSLQLCWSTGYVAGLNSIKNRKSR